MEPWHDLFAAVAGSAAALTGLIFVGISLNLTKILSLPKLPDRALISIILLLSVLIVSVLQLIPGQSLFAAGIEILCAGLMEWGIVFYLDMQIFRQTDKQFRYLYLFNLALSQLAILPFIISGIAVILIGQTGIYWLVAGIVFSIIKSVLDAWVLVIEINR